MHKFSFAESIRSCVRVLTCLFVCTYALRVVSTDKILHLTNTLIYYYYHLFQGRMGACMRCCWGKHHRWNGDSWLLWEECQHRAPSSVCQTTMSLWLAYRGRSKVCGHLWGIYLLLYICMWACSVCIFLLFWVFAADVFTGWPAVIGGWWRESGEVRCCKIVGVCVDAGESEEQNEIYNALLN